MNYNKQKTVLLVEDSPAQMISYKRLLEREGLKILWAPDGEAGVFMAIKHQPAAIIMDLQLPNMNGIEACKQIKQSEHGKDIPILVLTAHHTELSLVLEGLQAGTVDFIPKDAFAKRVLIETLKQLGIL